MTVSIKDLEAFADGWNRHDVDFLMTFMAEDCVFETSAGPEAAGKRYVGREQVREGFAGVFRRFPDVHFGNARHFVSGDRGLSEWLFTATIGRRQENRGHRLRRLHLQGRQDRGKELISQEPNGLGRANEFSDIKRSMIRTCLDGIRVLDFTQIGAGPTCTMMLGDFGAHVVKVEPPAGDHGRRLGPPWYGALSPVHVAFNRGKQSICIDLKEPAGKEVAHRLALKSDVLVESFRPGVMDSLGLGYRRSRPSVPTSSIARSRDMGRPARWLRRPGSMASSRLHRA